TLVLTYTYILDPATNTRMVYYTIQDKAGNVATYTDTIILDTGSPTGTIIIDGGANYTQDREVVLSLTWDDDISGVEWVQYSNDNINWTSWEALVSQKIWVIEELEIGSIATVYYRVKDRVGNISQVASDTITYNPNIITIVQPREGEHIKGIAKIVAICPSDARYAVFEQRRQDSITYQAIGTDTDQQDGWSIFWETPIDEATYTIKATAYSENNYLLGLGIISVLVDNQPPIGTLTITPSPASRTITGILTGSVDIKSVLFECGTITIAYDSNLPFGFMLDIISWSPGTYTFSATMEDFVGNKGTAAIDILIDNEQPLAKIISIDGDYPGAKILKGSVTIEFTGKDNLTKIFGTPTILIDGTAEYPASYWDGENGTYIWNTGRWEDGAHTLQIILYDSVGNCGQSHVILVNVRNTQPPVVILSPIPESLLSGTISILVSAPESTKYVAFAVGTSGETWFGLDKTGTRTMDYPENGWEVKWNTRGFDDGKWIILAEAYSITNKLIGSATTNIILDNTEPVIRLIEPVEGFPIKTRENSVISVFFSYTEKHPSLLTILVLDGTKTIAHNTISDGLPSGCITSFEPLVIPKPTNNGTYTLEIILKDRCGYSSRDIKYSGVLVDNTIIIEPFTIVSPDDWSLVSGTRTIKVVGPEGIRWINFMLGTETESSFIVIGSDSYIYDGWGYAWDTKQHIDGEYMVRVIGYDLWDKPLGSDTIRVTIDNTPPDMEDLGTITLIPKRTEYLEIYFDNIVIKGSVNTGVADISLNGIKIDPIDGKIWNIIPLIEGTNTIILRFRDMAGNEGSYTYTVVYIQPRITMEVNDNGGIVKNPNGSTVEIPTDAMLEGRRIAFNMVLDKEGKMPIDSNISFLKAHYLYGSPIVFYEITTDRGGYVFHKPVKVTLAYDDSNWDKNLNYVKDEGEIDERRLCVFWYDEIGRKWIKIESLVNPASNTITFFTNHLSIFAIGQEIIQSMISKLDVYLTRNPFKFGQETTFVFSLPEPGRVYIRIFDLSGDLVRELLDGVHYTTGSSVNWNGLNDVGDRYVGSGIYIYQFRVEYYDGKKEQIIKPIGVVK
ncbi:TPA: hypothetical protein DCX16_03010, partial [bacterium]|nr:hypothetical protein [bacterium]